MTIGNRNYAAGLFLIALAACSSEPVYKTIEVDTPVATSCVTAPLTHEPWPTQSVANNAALYPKVQAALAELDLRQAYEMQLEAMLAACR